MVSQKRLVSRKKLEIVLQNLKEMENPKPELEQYSITPQGASTILSIISNTYNDIQNKMIGDLGCGTGLLAIGAALLGAKQVIGVDIDRRQLDIADQNAKTLNIFDKIRWVQMNIQDFNITVDVIIQNPPFGVQKRDRGMDSIFLKKAMRNAPIIYSIHKSGTKNQTFLRNLIQNQQAIVDAIIPLQIVIPHLFEFHQKKSYPVQIDLYRIISKVKIQ